MQSEKTYKNPIGVLLVLGVLSINLILLVVSPIIGFMIGFVFSLPFILSTIIILREYERGVLFTLGRYSGTLGPGLNIIIPIIQNVVKVDLRITTIDIPTQTTITKDNVSVKINGVVYFRVLDPEKAVLKIDNYVYATANYAQTILRDVVSGITLDELLEKREEVAQQIKSLVDAKTDEWGIDITDIKLQDISLPSTMERAMAVQAEAERERRAIIIKSEGEKIAAKTYSDAAEMISKNKNALALRVLQTLSDISKDPSQKFIFVLPIEMLEAFSSKNPSKNNTKSNDFIGDGKIDERDIKHIENIIKDDNHE